MKYKIISLAISLTILSNPIENFLYAIKINTFTDNKALNLTIIQSLPYPTELNPYEIRYIIEKLKDKCKIVINNRYSDTEIKTKTKLEKIINISLFL